MINNIIKRDGTREPFLAEKVNGWGEWASANLGHRVDWSTVVMKAVASLGEECSSEDLQHTLIRTCLNMHKDSYNHMAGRLYATTVHKTVFPGGMPHLRDVHENLRKARFMVPLSYTAEEFDQINAMIDHERDFDYAHSQIHHVRYKYALRDRLGGAEYETPQFTFMRMAMALGETEPEDRLYHVSRWYHFFSNNIINAPTPNYVNLGTPLRGYASCCLYTTSDTADSLAIGDHIAYKMTVQAAGIGNNLRTRSLGDPIRGGLIIHKGKLPYLTAMAGAVRANMQNGRAGACTSYYSAFDPEVKDLMVLKNPMTPPAKANRAMDYTQMGNKFLARAVAKQEQIFLFNTFTAPDLYESFFSGDDTLFETLYAKYEADPNFKKTYVSAREIVLTMLNEAFETGRAFVAQMDEINRHTPFNDTIYCSNLCTEITEPTREYETMMDLYTPGPVGYIKFMTDDGLVQHYDAVEPVYAIKEGQEEEHWMAAQELKAGDLFMMGIDSDDERWATVNKVLDLKREPEVGLCSLGALVITNIKTDEEYAEAAYYTLKMIDKCIHMSEYVLPHLGYTAKQRLSAGVGIMDLAHHMARKNLKYSSQEGKEEIHRVAETHAWHVINASLQLGKELGNAPWMHRTKWIDGWVPTWTYNRNVDKIVSPDHNERDWPALSAAIKANKGIRNSACITMMPGESSSKASGCFNSILPARELALMKSDNDMTIYWTAPEGDTLKDNYEMAWDIPTRDLIDCYAVVQKFTDQSISADFFRRITGSEQITSDEMIKDYLHMVGRGMKTRYYVTPHTAGKVVLNAEKQTDHHVLTPEEEAALDAGVASGTVISEAYRDTVPSPAVAPKPLHEGHAMSSEIVVAPAMVAPTTGGFDFAAARRMVEATPMNVLDEPLEGVTIYGAEDERGCGSGGCSV